MCIWKGSALQNTTDVFLVYFADLHSLSALHFSNPINFSMNNDKWSEYYWKQLCSSANFLRINPVFSVTPCGGKYSFSYTNTL